MSWLSWGKLYGGFMKTAPIQFSGFTALRLCKEAELRAHGVDRDHYQAIELGKKERLMLFVKAIIFSVGILFSHCRSACMEAFKQALTGKRFAKIEVELVPEETLGDEKGLKKPSLTVDTGSSLDSALSTPISSTSGSSLAASDEDEDEVTEIELRRPRIERPLQLPIVSNWAISGRSPALMALISNQTAGIFFAACYQKYPLKSLPLLPVLTGALNKGGLLTFLITSAALSPSKSDELSVIPGSIQKAFRRVL